MIDVLSMAAGIRNDNDMNQNSTKLKMNLPPEKIIKPNKIEDAHDPYHKPVIFKISCLAKKARFFFPRISTPFSQRVV